MKSLTQSLPMIRVRQGVRMLAAFLFLSNHSPAENISVSDGLVTVRPPELQGAINNPLKGFRDYKEGGYSLIMRSLSLKSKPISRTSPPCVSICHRMPKAISISQKPG